MKTMFKSDLSKIRSSQKKTNRNLAETILHTDFTDKDLKKLINFKSLDRLAEVCDEDRQYIYDLIQSEKFLATILPGVAHAFLFLLHVKVLLTNVMFSKSYLTNLN